MRTSPDAPAGLEDIAFTIQGTGADLRFLDGNIAPSDREVGVALHGARRVANYLPAVVEANHSGVPLIVCTADRPPELRGWGAGQMSMT